MGRVLGVPRVSLMLIRVSLKRIRPPGSGAIRPPWECVPSEVA